MKPTKVLIVCSETKLDLKQYHDYYKIGVERGCLDLIKAFNQIDLVCCDQDSLQDDELAFITSKAKAVMEISQVKDYIDGEIAIQEALKLNPIEIVLVAQGHRFDMQLSCLNFIYRYNVIFINDHTYAYLLQPGMNEIIRKPDYRYFSLFALQTAAVTITNLKYNVENLTLVGLSANAISNEFVSATGNVDVLAGQVAAIYSK
ncbi:thiamine pyrophosphokinase [Spiroplasma sp. NBRC 100390]|uniref:thiamine diphosphokinase n=1 Tax=unclassified Spiroplasma TaxID=2637901 RepID=UPI0008929E3A|nr:MULTISPECIES: thiamine diphosphokinase [unclassified Spiroplasma]AOX44189.1 thiamine pyrophosphokinase [Spiroplasma sp. TU-14]APE13659.1 thiamine pyrophosphokinase [Spiroplasma sp. NBRC 100390]